MSRRDLLLPLRAAGLLLLAGIILHAAAPGIWHWVLLVAIVATAGALLVGERLGLRKEWERRAAAGAVGSGGAWLALATWQGAHRWPARILYPLLLLAGIPWWRRRRAGRSVVSSAPHVSRRVRRRQRGQGEQLKAWWPSIAEREQVKLPGSRIIGVTWGEHGSWEVLLQLHPGDTWRDAKRAASALESIYRLPLDSVEAAPVRSDASRALLRFAPAQPLTEGRTWSGPAKRRSILDPITLGWFQDGAPAQALLAFVHWLIAGMSGSGKSVLLNRVIGELAVCDDVILLGADLKDGLELTPWGEAAAGGVFEQITTTVEDTEDMLEQVVAPELERRGPLMRDVLRWKKWRPSREHPAIVLVIDEQGRLSHSERAVKVLELVAEQGRAKGIWLVSTFQKADKDAFGSNRIRNNMDVTVSLRLFSAAEARVVFGESANQGGWRPDQIPPGQQGTFYLLAATSQAPRLARAEDVPDELVARIRDSVGGHRPRLEIVTPRPGPAENPPAGAVPTQAAEPDDLVEDGGGVEAEDILRDLVTAGGPEGAPISLLLAEMEGQPAPLTRKRAWTYQWLGEHAEPAAKGRWRLKAPTTEGAE